MSQGDSARPRAIGMRRRFLSALSVLMAVGAGLGSAVCICFASFTMWVVFGQSGVLVSSPIVYLFLVYAALFGAPITMCVWAWMWYARQPAERSSTRYAFSTAFALGTTMGAVTSLSLLLMQMYAGYVLR
jgi:hypothetical protein